MKKLFAYIFFVVFACSLNAQNVTIPDINFKNKLIEREIDLDGDGEIQVQEALFVQYLDVSNANIQSLTGIEQFTNIREFNCENNQISVLPLNTLTFLKRVNCSNNNISSLDFNTFSLQELRCAHNQISSINIGPATLELDISYNQISQLNIPTSASYAYLNISGNLYDEVAIRQLRLENFYCEDTRLTSLDLSQTVQLGETISIRNNTELQSLNLKNNRFDFCDVMGGGCHFYLALSGNPSLNNICLDTFDHEGVSGLNELDFFQTQYNLTNVNFNQNCDEPAPELTITDLNKAINCYPNPVKDVLNLETKNSTKIQSYAVYNLMGQKIQSQNLNQVSFTRIDVTALLPGTYMLEIISDKGTKTNKIIKI